MPIETLKPMKKEVKLKEHAKEFGNKEAEEMARKFLEEDFDCFRRVRRASEYDDKKQAIDLIAEFENGELLGIQFTITTDVEKQEEKAKKVLFLGTTELHDNYGKITDKRKTPLVMIFEDKIKWGKSYNQYLKEEGKDPLQYLPNQAETKKDFLKDMIISLKAQAIRHPGDEQIFFSRLKILEKELEEHLEEHKELVG